MNQEQYQRTQTQSKFLSEVNRSFMLRPCLNEMLKQNPLKCLYQPSVHITSISAVEMRKKRIEHSESPVPALVTEEPL